MNTPFHLMSILLIFLCGGFWPSDSMAESLQVTAASIEGVVKDQSGVPLIGVNIQIKGTSKGTDRKSTRLNSSHVAISYAVFCLKKKKTDAPIAPNIISYKGTKSWINSTIKNIGRKTRKIEFDRIINRKIDIVTMVYLLINIIIT